MSQEKYAQSILDWMGEKIGEEEKASLAGANILWDIAAAIYKDRTAKGMTQSEYAKLLGVSQVMISKLESHDYNPTIDTLSKMAHKLDFNFKIVFEPKYAANNNDYSQQIAEQTRDYCKS